MEGIEEEEGAKEQSLMMIGLMMKEKEEVGCLAEAEILVPNQAGVED